MCRNVYLKTTLPLQTKLWKNRFNFKKLLMKKNLFFYTPSLVKWKRGRPPGPAVATLPPFNFQNKGGIQTRSQAAKERLKEFSINSLLPTTLICFKNCEKDKHSKLCFRMALNFSERGDTYLSLLSFPQS